MCQHVPEEEFLNLSDPGKLRVLHFIDHDRVGGPGKTIINCAKYADRSRFEIHAAFFANGCGTDFAKAVENEGIPRLVLRDRNGIEWNHIKGLREYIRREKIKILHTHGYKTDFLGLMQRGLAGEPALVTTHHGWICNNARQNIYAMTGRGLSRWFDGVILVSESMERFLPAAVRKSGSFTIIHNAIVMEDYETALSGGKGPGIRKRFAVGAGDMLIGVIGRLSEEKGCLEMLLAFHELQKVRKNFKLMFVGEGGLRAGMERTARELGLCEKVIFAGYMDPVAPVYREIDVLVCPSRTEGLSNVILEAMACRVPVIATAVGGNTEIISAGHNGIIISRAAAEELAGPLLELAGRRELREKLVRNAYQTVKKKFSFSARMRKEEEFYLSIMLKRSRPAGRF